MSQPRSTLDGLPKDFIKSLRVLFDILDDSKTGYVKLTDIAAHWETETVSGLPPGIIEALKKVTPPSGQLSFERFVAGLKIALLRLKSDKGNPQSRPKTQLPHSVSQPDLIPSKYPADGPSRYNPPASSQITNPTRTKSLSALGWNVDTDPAGNVVRPEPHYAWHQPGGHKDQQFEQEMQSWKKSTESQFHDRRPGDGRSSVSTAAALQKMSENLPLI